MPERCIVNATIKAMRGLPRYPDVSVLDVSCGDAEILE